MLKLSQKELDIFYCTQLQPNRPVQKIRELSGYRDHTIRYCVQRGLERGLLIPRCFVNLNLLGYNQYEIFFSTSSEKKQARSELLKALTESEKVSWIGEVGGDFQYGINICARSLCEVMDFLESFSSRFGQIFLEKQIALRISLDYFGNKYFSSKKRAKKSLSYCVTDSRVQIDEVDHKILSTTMDLTHRSRRKLAQQTSLPLSTLEYRIKKLERAGVIVGYYYLINPAQIGIQSFLLLVGLKGVSAHFKQVFYKFCSEHPNIVVFIHNLGSWDFELVVEVEDSRFITTITQDLYDNFGSYLQFVKVLPYFGISKIVEYPFENYQSLTLLPF